ncbi:hypothetical protein BGZ97_007521 [Linnemannia gamsii]|uniref:Uncharacterized protein n=1 Tax=Linnemannia gamsii TaxID=64522 RepID=A0A9P6QPM6_9FUNG|nr:hypothetical protein BGZ97_007521 [Linnemannia gamsii]
MNLAEIRKAVGPYLSRKELAASIRCCREWHASFIPFLYCDFEFNGNFPIENFDRGDSGDELDSLFTIPNFYRGDSESDDDDNPPISVSSGQNLRDLKELGIYLSWRGDRGSFRLLLNQVLINNPGLQRLSLSGLDYPDCLKQLYKHATCPSSSLDLTELRFFNMSLTGEDLVALLDASPRLTTLSLRECHIRNTTKKLGDEENVSGTKNNNHIKTNTSTYTYNINNNNSRVKVLRLDGSLGSYDGLSTVVDWTDEEERFFLQGRTSVVMGPLKRLPSCPGLSELELEGVHMVDGELAKILTAFPGLTRLVIPGLYVGPTDFGVLARTLLGFLTVLDFGQGRDSGGWDHIKPWMWKRILCFGSRLVELGMDKLDTEVLGEQMMNNPWACRASLKILRIRCVSLSHDHTSNLWAMRELMTLKGLEDLSVHNIHNPNNMPNYNNCHSKIAMESKANPERTLKNIAAMNKNGTSSTTETILVKFCLGGSLKREEIVKELKSQWILETWPKIKCYRSSGDQHWYS